MPSRKLDLEKYRDALLAGKRKQKLQALVALGEAGGSAMPVVDDVKALLSDADQQVRATAAQAIQEIGPPDAIELLRHCAADESPMVRGSVAVGLHRLGETSASKEIFGQLKNSDSDEDRQFADLYESFLDED